MTHDLLIRGGTIVDGSGRPACEGDVAIDGDRISAVGPVDGRARRVLAATGQALAPPAALHKVGGGEPFFYAEGEFVVEAPRGQVDGLRLVEPHGDVRLAPQDVPQGCRDVGRRQSCRGDLVEQRLEQVVVGAVHQRDAHGR